MISLYIKTFVMDYGILIKWNNQNFHQLSQVDRIEPEPGDYLSFPKNNPIFGTHDHTTCSAHDPLHVFIMNTYTPVSCNLVSLYLTNNLYTFKKHLHSDVTNDVIYYQTMSSDVILLNHSLSFRVWDAKINKTEKR